MRILAISLSRPGHVLHTVADFWKSQGHEVDDVRIKASYLGEFLGVFRPWKKYDVAITAEPLVFLGPGRWLREAKRRIFWRIDLKRGLLRELGDGLIARKADEVWSIVPEGRRANERYVPALLRGEEIVESEGRGVLILWSGSDVDGMLPLAREAMVELKREVIRTSWEKPLTEEELRALMGRCKVGLALYKGEKADRQYSDPMRVKRYLGAGLPVVMSGDFPFAREVQREGAGIICEESVEGIRRGIEKCLENFEVMSRNAYKLATKYIVSERWVGL